MFYYFGYASNMNMASLKSKGVTPVSSLCAELKGWRLCFNIKHWFRHEGGVANIVKADPGNRVLGLVHLIDNNDLKALDAVESYKSGYDRIEVDVETPEGPKRATTYVGLPAFIDEQRKPTQRYKNIIVNGAVAAGIDERYLQELKSTPVQDTQHYPSFVPPQLTSSVPQFDEAKLASYPLYTAMLNAVFDMQNARHELRCVHPLFGGKDTTLFHLRRHHSSYGGETYEDIVQDRVPAEAKDYLNAYLHEYNEEFRYVGVYNPAIRSEG